MNNKINYNLYEELGDKKFLDIDKAFIDTLNKSIETISVYKRPLFEKISDHYLNTFTKYAIIRNNLLSFVTTLPYLKKNNDPAGKELKHLLLEKITNILQESINSDKEKIAGEYGPISN